MLPFGLEVDPVLPLGAKRGARGVVSFGLWWKGGLKTYDSVMVMPERLCDRRGTIVSSSPLRRLNDKERRRNVLVNIS